MPVQTSRSKFKILVVDDDVISLNIISSMLRTWNYEVFTVNCPHDALAIIKVQGIDLIVSDLYMRKMNGLQLQKQIEAEFELPVIIISSDDNEKIIIKCLSSGAVYFMSKPVNPMDLKDLWQYAVASKRDKSMRYIEKIGSIQAIGSMVTTPIGKTSYNVQNNSTLTMNEGKGTRNKKESKRKSQKKIKEKMEGETSVAPKKGKVVWNDALHNLFLQAIRHLTLEKAVPKSILEFMNVPGLTTQNVSSHLQKYRIFLKRVAEKDIGATFKMYTDLDKTFQSRSMEARSLLTLYNSQGGPSDNNSRSALFLSPSPFGFGQSRLLGGHIQANVHKPCLSNRNPLYQSNHIGLVSNYMRTNMLSGGGAKPMSSTNSMQIPNGLCDNMSTPLIGTSAISSPSYGVVGNNNMESIGTENVSFSNQNSNLNYFNNNNYAGIQIYNDGNLTAIGDQVRLNGTDGLNGAVDHGLTSNEAQTPSVDVGAVRNPTFDSCLAPGEFSSAGYEHENYKSPTAFSGVNCEHGNISVQPSVTQQQFGLNNEDQLNDFVSDMMIDNNNVASSISKPQQCNEFANRLIESSNCQFTYHQQQSEEGCENPNFASSSSFPSKTNPRASQPLDVLDHFLSPLNIEEEHSSNEPSLEQLLEIEELLNTDLENNIANPSDDYHPIMEKTTNQGWDDDFMNSLFDDGKF